MQKPTVKEFDDVRKLHVVLENDISVVFDERQGDEQDEVCGGDMFRSPNRLPQPKHVVINQFYRERGRTVWEQYE